MKMINKDTYDALPDAAKAAFVEDGEQYVPVKDAKLKQTLDDLDHKFKSTEQRAKELEQQLSGFEASKKAEIESAREQAMEEARSKGDVKAIEERYQQQMIDLENRTREEARNEALKEFKIEQAESRSISLSEKIGLTLGLDSDCAEAITSLIKHRVKTEHETGSDIFHDIKGSALSVDIDGFIEYLRKEKQLSRLIKCEIAASGGGLANGSGHHFGDGQSNEKPKLSKATQNYIAGLN